MVNDGGPHAARMAQIEGLEDHYRLLRGVRLAEGFPGNVRFRMNDNFPENLQLEDVLANRRSVILAGSRFTEFFSAEKLKNVEILPVATLDHKGNPVKDRYSIIHPVELQDCIDRDASDIEMNRINPKLIGKVRELVVDESRIDPEVKLFRMESLPFLPVVERSFAETMLAQGFSGFRFAEFADHRW